MRLRKLGSNLIDRFGGNSERELPDHDRPREPRHAAPSHPGLENLARTAEMADPVGTTLEPTAPPQQVQHFAIAGQDIRRKADDEAGFGVAPISIAGQDIRREAKDEPGFEVSTLVTSGYGDERSVPTSAPDDGVALPGEEDSLW